MCRRGTLALLGPTVLVSVTLADLVPDFMGRAPVCGLTGENGVVTVSILEMVTTAAGATGFLGPKP